MKRLFHFLFICFPLTVLAQFNYKLSTDVPVQEGETTLEMPWAGGLNSPQYNTMDLNGDDVEDLVLYDRTSSQIIPFLQLENKYIHAPEYARFFPEDIQNWLVLRDYNCDGKKDVFTWHVFGIKIYTNTTAPLETPSWSHYMFYTPGVSQKFPALLTKGLDGNRINLQLPSGDDLPAIADADGDGDLDIFSMSYSTGNAIDFNKNFSMERYGTCDSLEFERQTRTWGGVKECVCGNFAFNNDDCPGNGRTQHTSGKTLTALDADGNGVMDLLISESDCNSLYLLKNEGDLANPSINSASLYPDDVPVNQLLYPAAYFEDIDFDGVKDFIASPNFYSLVNSNTDLKNSNWFYQNNGTSASPMLNFVKTNFLQETMIDVGSNATPVLLDFDNDGDSDLLVSRYTSENFTSTILHYENTGSETAPAFNLINDDFLNFSTRSFYNLKIHIADMNSDGRMDLVFTATSFFNNFTGLYYVPNTSSSNYSWSFANVQAITLPQPIQPSENIFAIDVDRDGKTDLLHGKSNGALYFWQNKGSFAFELASTSYLGIASSFFRQNLSCTAADLNADGKLELILSDQNGKLYIINNFYAATSLDDAVVNVIWNTMTEQYEPRNLGGRIWPTVGNLFNVAQPALLIGNTLGGIVLLRPQDEQALPEKPSIAIYPNPVVKSSPLTIKSDRVVEMELLSVLGQTLAPAVVIQSYQPYALNTDQLARGIYLLKFKVEKQSIVKRFIVE